ncbi:glycosyltransferase [Flavobacterium ginsengiterrae]|uniref:Glycosyltransferase involved in cell wall biosynthesis n=1 Tax=Flavobacterium ginsengiterrae TaxID=871695 RepID=A0ABP7H238_9FLAO
MKILFVSMSSIHVLRWIENLKNTDHELYWFDVLGRGSLDTEIDVKQFISWKKRKLPQIKGEFFLYKKMPKVYNFLLPYIEKTANEVLEEIVKEIKPDIIHSFEMQSCTYPIIKAMNKYSKIPWIYSCWGNDLFYYQKYSSHVNQIKKALRRIDFIHTDCQRDYFLAKTLGFNGKNLGVIPGGTGYNIKELKDFRIPIEKRKIILVKGYQNIFGRGLNVVKALEKIQEQLKDFEVVVFGSHKPVIDYIAEKKLPFKIYHRHDLKHDELLHLMGKSLIYIGNNISDGMANTLLEAIVMGAFPIQSDPGGVSAEIIEHNKNGFLIENPEDIELIKNVALNAVNNFKLLKTAQELNFKIASSRLDYDFNKKKVLQLYKEIFQ